jgi:hypothetical protein
MTPRNIKNEVMVDIETFGNGKYACIVQIGACYFDRDTGEIRETFKANIDARSSVKAGAEIDADTVYWWLKQSKEAIASITAEPLKDIKATLIDFNTFMSKAQCVWSHATFDFVILTEAMKRLSIKPSFSYRTARDIRTLVDLANTHHRPNREGTHHDALDDCKFQVQYCVEALNKLKGGE